MRIVERFANLADDFHRSLVADVFAIRRIENVGEGFAFHPLHDDEIEIIIAIKVYESNDSRVRQAASFGGLLLQCAQCRSALR